MDFFFSCGRKMLVLGREMPYELCNSQVFPIYCGREALVLLPRGRLAPGPRELLRPPQSFCLLAV